jgi:hypothetical protein
VVARTLARLLEVDVGAGVEAGAPSVRSGDVARLVQEIAAPRSE